MEESHCSAVAKLITKFPPQAENKMEVRLQWEVNKRMFGLNIID